MVTQNVRLEVSALAAELEISEADLKTYLYNFRRARTSLGGPLAGSVPSEATIRKWFSNSSIPSSEGLGFILEYLQEEHDNIAISYSARAIGKIRRSARNRGKISLSTIDNLLIEEARRKAYQNKKSREIEEDYVGFYAIARQRFNGTLVIEPLVVHGKKPDNANLHRNAIWRVSGHVFCGDLIFGYKSIGGGFVIQTTDRPLNLLNINICFGKVDSNGSLAAKITATTPDTGDIYSKNAILIKISEFADFDSINFSDRQSSSLYLDGISKILNDDLFLAPEVANFLRSGHSEVRRNELEQIINGIDGPVLGNSTFMIKNKPVLES